MKLVQDHMDKLAMQEIVTVAVWFDWQVWNGGSPGNCPG